MNWYKEAQPKANYKQPDPQVFYHGTDIDTSKHIDDNGWTTDRREKGITSPTANPNERKLTFITPSRNAALWFATLGGSRKAGEYKVIPVRFTGKILDVPGATSIYECAEALGVATDERGLVWDDFVNKLKAAGYQAVSFHDRNAGPRGRPAVAVFDNNYLQKVDPKTLQQKKASAEPTEQEKEPEVWMHGTKDDIEDFEPGRTGTQGVIFFSRLKDFHGGNTPQAQYYTRQGGRILKAIPDKSRMKRFDPRNDPQAAAVMEKLWPEGSKLPYEIESYRNTAFQLVNGKILPVDAKWPDYVPYPEIPEIVAAAKPFGYNLFRVYEPSVSNFSWAVSDPSLVKVISSTKTASLDVPPPKYPFTPQEQTQYTTLDAQYKQLCERRNGIQHEQYKGSHLTQQQQDALQDQLSAIESQLNVLGDKIYRICERARKRAADPTGAAAKPRKQPSQGQQWLSKVVRHYGYTNDPREAGYIHPNGQLIDFSGKKKNPNAQRGQRAHDHREVEFVDPAFQTAEAQQDRPKIMRTFMMHSGAIRIHVGDDVLAIQMAAVPTNKQVQQILTLSRGIKGEVSIDAKTPDGEAWGKVITPPPMIEGRAVNLSEVKAAISEATAFLRHNQ